MWMHPAAEREPVEGAACALCRRHHSRRQMSGGCSQRKNEAVACAWRVKCAWQEACSLQLPVSREQEIDVLVTADAADGAIPSRTVDEGIPGQTAGNIHGQRDCVAMHSREDAAKIWGHSGKKRCGAAVDIGTTTLAATLYDLTDRKRIAAASSVNHQRAYGADVLSRIQAANEGAAEELRLSICRDIDALLAGLVADAGIPDDAVEELVIVGNTTMCHLLRGLSCAGLGAAPFTPEDLSLWEGSGAELALSGRWSVSVTILPGISAFVGADIVAGIYALEMDRKKNVLLLDIGTNGEMAAGGADGFLVTSAAAGPVFEGGNISCGVAGVPGAVTNLVLERDPAATGGIRTVELSTIAGETPIGLCGTGIIDAVGEAVRLGLIDENGTFEEPWFTDGMPVAEGQIPVPAGGCETGADGQGGDPCRDRDAAHGIWRRRSRRNPARRRFWLPDGRGAGHPDRTVPGTVPWTYHDDRQQCACGSRALSAR